MFFTMEEETEVLTKLKNRKEFPPTGKLLLFAKFIKGRGNGWGRGEPSNNYRRISLLSFIG
jgi:hypothetical protein